MGIFKFSCLRLQLLFIYRMAQYKPLEISDGVEYPQYAQTIGWILTCFVMCPIPIYFIYKVVTAEGSLMEVRKKNMFIEFFLNQFNGQLFKMRYVNGNISHTSAFSLLRRGQAIAFIQNMRVCIEKWIKALSVSFSKENNLQLYKLVDVLHSLNQKDDSH